MANEEPDGKPQSSEPEGGARALVVATVNIVSQVNARYEDVRELAAIPVPPLGLPEQIEGMPTAPSDRGDETQDRFRYQWAMGAVLLAQGITGENPCAALWCEHHEDFLVELTSGKYRAVQVKTDSAENAKWKVTSEAFVSSIKRFCALEKQHGEKIAGYEFCSNAPPYVPTGGAVSEKTLVSSPLRLCAACTKAADHVSIETPYSDAFQILYQAAESAPEVLFAVMRKLAFRQGPPLRGYLDTLVAQVVPSLPNCTSLSSQRLKIVRDELMRVVETASGLPRGELDGVLAYIASNGRPEISIRGKCITISAAKACVEQAGQSTFRYVRCGEKLPLGQVAGQKLVLHKKMRNAFLEGQFEPMWMRAIAAEQRLLAKALDDPDGLDALVTQLEGTVLTECKDAEAFASSEQDERKRGIAIYRTVLENLTNIARNEPERVENEPKETLIGVAGMLSGSCRFAWGVPLDGEENGA